MVMVGECLTDAAIPVINDDISNIDREIITERVHRHESGHVTDDKRHKYQAHDTDDMIVIKVDSSTTHSA